MTAKVILITGCSEGGLGDALAQEFHKRGQHVIASGRNPAKLAHFKELGIETQQLDVLSEDSIKECVIAISKRPAGKVDILINNSGAGYSMPLADASITEAKKLFDLNVWSVLAVTQAFLPLIQKSDSGTIVNNTSVVSELPNPFGGIYNSSKAATAMLTDTLRLELKPFGIKVIELKTGAVTSKFFQNLTSEKATVLPQGSIYEPIREVVERNMSGGVVEGRTVEAQAWAKGVVGDLLSMRPPNRIWRGGDATLVWLVGRFLGYDMLSGTLEKLSGLAVLRSRLQKMGQNI